METQKTSQVKTCLKFSRAAAILINRVLIILQTYFLRSLYLTVNSENLKLILNDRNWNNVKTQNVWRFWNSGSYEGCLKQFLKAWFDEWQWIPIIFYPKKITTIMIFYLRIACLWSQRYSLIISLCKKDAITVFIWKSTKYQFIIIINFN